MKRTFHFLLLTCCFAIHSASAQPLEPLFDNNGIQEEARGTWQNLSYGYTLDISENRLALYHYSKAGCIKDPVSSEDLAGLVRYFARSGDKLQASMRQSNSTVYTFEPISGVPEICQREMAGSPQVVFDYFWSLMDAHYAFFDVHDVDWAERRTMYADQVSDDMSEEALYEVLTGMLEGLNDGHLGLSAVVNGEEQSFSASKTRVLGAAITTAFEAQDEIEERSEFSTKWFFGSLDRFRNHVLDRRGQGRAAGGNMNWGRIGNIGYISVFGMGGFNEDEGGISEELSAVHEAMNRALEDLADTDGLIFDIALNQGGMDEVSLALASHFTDSPQLAYTKTGYRSNTPPQPFYVQPAEGVKYLKPVTLFTSDLSVSAAEIFTMAMRALPNVTHRGDTTWGALSDILSKSLPNGWELELSNEIYQDAAGELWEGRGIEPAEKYVVFDPENLFQSHHNAILIIAQQMKREIGEEM